MPSPLLSVASLFLVGLSAAVDYDYIILGAGPAGLTLANRLTEDGTKQVLVLEAGQPHLNEDQILIPGFLGGTLGNPDYDWLFTTAPQPGVNNRSVLWSRGKALGGSTAVNFMAYGRPASGEFDALETLGNPGWNWDNLFKYIKKSETFAPPGDVAAAEYNFTYVASAHGTTGPVHNSFAGFVSDGQLPWTSSLKQLGLDTIPDALGGQDVGAWYTPANIDNATKTRSYAANAYYQPISTRPNLEVITGAFVNRLVIGPVTGGLAKATGVEYVVNGALTVVDVKDGAEVIVSTGSINTPKILELSGIGDPSVLTPLGIPVKVNLSSVGNGMIDHVFLGASYELKNSSIVTLDSLRDPTFAAQALAEYNANKTGVLTVGVSAFALAPLQALTSATHALKLIAKQTLRVFTGGYNAATKALLIQQLYQLVRPTKFGLVEFVAFPGFFTTATAPVAGKKYVTFTVDLQFPFSRGSIHVASADPTVQPLINPNYLSEDFDLQALVLGLKFARKLSQTGGFADLIAGEADPGPSYVTDTQLITYIKNNLGTEYHTVGTSAMLPRSKGGVVSSELKIYGTNNVRVVDLSVLPIQISAHPQSTVYGIAEKAADIIRGITTV